MVNALAVHDLELGLLEGGRHLVFHHLDAGLIAHHLVTLFDRAGAANVKAHRRVELEGVTAGGGLGVAEHDADLHANLVDKNHQAVGLLDGAGELAHGLAEQARLQADVGIAHLALDFRPRGERRHRVYHQHIHRAGTHQHLGHFQCLFTGIRLGHDEVLDPDTEFLGVDGVERVFGVDKGGGAAGLLGLGDHLQGEGGFAR